MKIYSYSNDLNLDKEKLGSEFLLDAGSFCLDLVKIRVVESNGCKGCAFHGFGCAIYNSCSCELNDCKYEVVGKIKRDEVL